MEWLCGDWRGKAVPGSNVIAPSNHLQNGFFDACQLCVLRQAFSKPPIQVNRNKFSLQK
jgi:hypothetical protein